MNISTNKIQEWEQLTHEKKHIEALISVAKFFGFETFIHAFQEILNSKGDNFDNSCGLLAKSLLVQIAYVYGEEVSDLVFSCL